MARPQVVPATPLTAAQKLRLSLEMFRYGCDMMRQNLRRAHPDEDPAAIEERLRSWLRTRPGAPHGDGIGRPGTWPRRHHARPDGHG